MTTESTQTGNIEQQCANASFILGMAIAALHQVQTHLIQDNAKEALKSVNDALRTLNPKIEKAFYSHLEKPLEVQNESA